MDFLRLRTMVA